MIEHEEQSLERLPSFLTPALVRKIAEQVGTPVYVYSKEVLARQTDRILRFPNIRFDSEICHESQSI